MSAPAPGEPGSVHEGRQRAAITAIFAVNGAVYAALFARLPALADRLDLGPGALGFALLGAPLGLILAQPLTGALVATRGARPVLALAPLYLLAVVLPALAPDLALFVVALVVAGAANGVLDVSMNVEGIEVERRLGRHLFNSLHGGFSLGALVGALAAGGAVALGLSPAVHLAVWGAAGAAVAAVAVAGLPRSGPPPTAEDGRRRRMPRVSPRLAAIAAFAFCVLLAEGAVFDWSAVYMVDVVGTGEALAPLALAAFSLAMGLGRIGADPLVARTGPARLARLGPLVAVAGLALALALATPAATVAGLGLMGIGLAATFPLALRAAGGPGQTAAPEMAAVSTVGYTGFLTGPPVIGLLAAGVGLRGGLVLVVALLVAAVALSTVFTGRA